MSRARSDRVRPGIGEGVPFLKVLGFRRQRAGGATGADANFTFLLGAAE